MASVGYDEAGDYADQGQKRADRRAQRQQRPTTNLYEDYGGSLYDWGVSQGVAPGVPSYVLAERRRSEAQQAAQAKAPSVNSLQGVYEKFLSSVPKALEPSPQVDLSPVTNAVQEMLKERAADKAAADQQRAAMRDLLSKRVGEASAPVNVNTPGIKEQLAAQRLARQRSAERQRSQAATRLSVEGLGDSGVAETTYQGIEQARGEGESADVAEVLGAEHNAKRNELLALLNMAISQGNTEQAQAIQQQIAGIDATLSGLNMQQNQRQFSDDLGFRKSSFMDNLGLQLLMAGVR